MTTVENVVEAKLINSSWGDVFTKRFLKSLHVVMVSEGDFLNRLKICVRAVACMPFFLLVLGVYLYYRIAIIGQYSDTEMTNEVSKLILDQKVSIDTMIIIDGFNILMMMYCLIVMLNLTMGKSTYAVTMIFNVFYITEALFFGSFIFIFDWAGIIQKFKSGTEVLKMLRSQWIYLFIYFFAVICFSVTKKIFKDFNAWNREWIRIDRYRKTEDRENAFIFKTWVTPGEVKARKLMLATAWFLIFFANIMDLIDVLKWSDFEVLKYVVLAVGYTIFIGAWIVPYSKWSIPFYWGAFLFSLIVFALGLYHIQNTAWKSNYFEYSYILAVIPFSLTLHASLVYTWTIRNKVEIQAVVVSEFETPEDFSQFVQNNVNEKSGGIISDDALNV